MGYSITYYVHVTGNKHTWRGFGKKKKEHAQIGVNNNKEQLQ